MAYEVLARKWRPQQLEEVLGQRAVTQTLQNAITSGRLAQAFVFAGPRGVGKTTTARILARALNCAAGDGPTPTPCGTCDACVEIAQGRDIDVLEIDAATHTQIDNVREVIIETLAIRPVRDRYKIFIIDEVHQLSNHSFNALLKSIEEPPPHVVFIMATTELRKIPDTILSRSQVFEFKAITSRMIADQLRAIASAEGIAADEAALALIARAAEGSMRDATSALDQVIAFAGSEVTVDAVSTVLGLVGRDLLLDIVEAVAAEDQAAAFELAARAVEAGHELRQVCRELTRVVRDLMVVSVDPGRLQDPEIAQEGERERLSRLAGRFSREDLLRSFDVLARAEHELRASAHPRYTFEMALLRWMHLRQLVPLSEIIERLDQGGGPGPGGPGERPRPAAGSAAPGRTSPGTAGRAAPGPPARAQAAAPSRAAAPGSAPDELRPVAAAPESDGLKDALLARIRSENRFFYGSVASQALRVTLAGERVVFAFGPGQRHLRLQFDSRRSWIEGLAAGLGGGRLSVVSEEEEGGGSAAALPARGAVASAGEVPGDSPGDALRARALEDAGVQALLDVFPAEITEIEEIDN